MFRLLEFLKPARWPAETGPTSAVLDEPPLLRRKEPAPKNAVAAARRTAADRDGFEWVIQAAREPGDVLTAHDEAEIRQRGLDMRLAADLKILFREGRWEEIDWYLSAFEDARERAKKEG